MAEVISNVFSLPEFEATEPFTHEKNRPIFEAWMKGTGPAHLFIYYQKPYKVTDQGEVEEVRGSREEFLFSDGEQEKLLGKGVYFLRTTPAGKGINPAKTDDAEVMFGEVSDKAVPALNTLINSIYKPLVDKMKDEDWKVCEAEHKKEFVQTFDKFSKDIQEALKSLETNITLDPYPEKHREEAKNVVAGSKSISGEMISDFEYIFNKWSEKIEGELDSSDSNAAKDKDAGPMIELEYWKQRMRKLTCVSEQLRSKNCRTVYDVLTASASSSTTDGIGKPRDKIYLATSKWRSIELKVTEALSEAKDNVKYLQTLDKFIEPLYFGTPESIKEQLPALMNSIKMIHTIARYYNTNERMTGLF
jgi:dynein heavy chain